MREKNRKPIASIKKLPQFTTMNVIDGQAGLISYFSLIFYSLTIDNILNIIVLLILAGVSIAMLTGENGVLTKATESKEQTGIAQEKEEITLAYAAAKTNKGDKVAEDITADELNTELDKLNSTGEASGTGTLTVTFENGHKYTIDQGTGAITGPGEGPGETPEEPDDEGEEIGTEESYVGYYADVDGDGEVDGVIYVDLADTGNTSGQWVDSDGNYEYTAVTEGLKKYKVSEETYSGFGGKWEKPIVTEIKGRGEKDRFYVMALEDFKGNDGKDYYCWYDAANGQMSDYSTATGEEIGDGKGNTEAMITKWNSEGYGVKDDNSTYRDMWGIIQEADKNGKKWDLNKWFVPSKAEWAAFGDFAYTDMGVDEDNYGNFGLSNCYWSSSQSHADRAYGADFDFDFGFIGNFIVHGDICVRLSATF